MHKAWIDGKHVAIRNDVQIVKQYEIDPSLDPNKKRPLVANYTVEFPLSDFLGYFDPARSLELCREMYPNLVLHAFALCNSPSTWDFGQPADQDTWHSNVF